ncbi:hypothetical protein [Arthrobacter sp. H41]|uniref:hypothetical protein n=1 Tax=Arthrobacter sp. H41 TaxID=1312978 RepID=UPI000478DFC5|nr:hypothetical protein [Arthrobacter sp. H41]
MTVIFTPTFAHTPWVDNRDRVQAAGPNGFNVRFGSLQADMQALATVVADIDAALDGLAAGPGAQQHVLTLPPFLSATQGSSAWALDQAGYAVKPAGQSSVAGIAPAVVPHGVTITHFRVSGQNSGSGSVRISLMRARLLGAPAPAERLGRVTGDATPFDNTVAADPALALVDTTTFRYFVLATVDGAAGGDTVSLAGFSITYLA